MRFALGQSAPRVEDLRLLRGGGRYTDDINLQGQAYAYMLRSPYSHARIRSIDTSEAAAMPGVIKVYTGTEIAAAGLGRMPCLAAKLLPLTRPDGSPMYEPKRLALSEDKVAFVGDYVAFVVAETRAQARDAADLIEVDYEELDPVVEIQDALAATPTAIWDDCSDNICFRMDVGDKAATDTAFANAHHVSRVEIPFARRRHQPHGTRAAIGEYDRFEDRYTLLRAISFPTICAPGWPNPF